MNETYETRFLTARRRYIASQFANLNEMQQEAVLTTDGPLLLLAGAGSGKTTVLINRIANLMKYGSGADSYEIPEFVDEEDVEFLEHAIGKPLSESDTVRADRLCAIHPAAPWNIIAITFTNKAANELKERLSLLLGPEAQEIWAMTFHSACCRILRREIERMGYTRSFTIYDSADSERMMKDVIKEMGLDDKSFPARVVLNAISREKDNLATPGDLMERARETNDVRLLEIARAYDKYQTRLKENNALDFDDILCVTVRLLREYEDVRQHYQHKFRFVLVDEYQDTNHVQYLLTSLLAGGHQNICVVGDDDQSIYRFRGATIENILSFEDQYKNARVIRLEQNYRSTQRILDAANAVIANNTGRKGKTLWTANDSGDPITIYEAYDESAEGNFVAGRILAGVKTGSFKDHAILYRTNAQSNALEFALKRNGIPYRVIGGMRFFDRAEVKDMVSYLCVINNRADDLRLKRIINTPARGLGAKTIESAERLAQADHKSLYSVVADPYSYGPLEKSAMKLMQFVALIEGLADLLNTGISLPDFYDEVLKQTGYVEMLENKPTEENKTRLENVRELKSSINAYVDGNEEPTLAGFLEEIALYTDLERYNEADDAVVMMTMHSAKGLEFPHVFLVGFEDNLFPGIRAIGDKEEMEEERRLCYVAMTRAKKTLTISHAKQRMLYGRTASAIKSRFLKEIPEEYVVRKGGVRPKTEPSTFNSYNNAYGGYGSHTRKPSPQQIARKEHIKRSEASTLSAKPAAPSLELNKGDLVMHAAFGKGMVLSVLKMSSDALLEIAFDDIGTKKLMAKTAAAHMKKL